MAAGYQVRTVREKARELYLSAYARRGFYSRAATCEDLWIALVAHPGRRGGFFVDVGDGVFGNNTFLLEQRLGWSGICIEPRRAGHGDPGLRRRARLAPGTVPDREGVTAPAGAPSTGGPVHRSPDDPAGYNGPRPPVRAASLAQILHEAGAPAQVDYLSLNAGGDEAAILETFPFGRHSVSALSVSAPAGDRLARILAPHGHIEVINPFARPGQRLVRFFVHPGRVHPRAVQPAGHHMGTRRGNP